MTTPITTVEPSKAKTWIAVVGGLLTVVVPLIVSVSTYLPEPWPAVIGAVVALLTAFGVYKAPYKPGGTTVVPTAELEQVATPMPPTKSDIDDVPPPSPGLGGRRSSWQ